MMDPTPSAGGLLFMLACTILLIGWAGWEFISLLVSLF